METHNINVESEVTLLMGGCSGVRADELIRQGVPLAALDRLAKHGIDVIRLGIIKPRTLSHRRSRGEPLSAEEGDRLYRASRIILLAEEVFGSQEKASKWLQKARKALGGISALEAIATTPGFVAADELLEQLRYGFVA